MASLDSSSLVNATNSDINSTHTQDRIIFPPYLTYFAAISAVVLSIVGVSGNLLTILALTKDKKLRVKATTSFIISLSVSDLLFCGFNLPLTAVRYFQQAWILGDQLCRVFPFLFYGNVAASLMSMVAVTINRYVIIGCFKHYASIYTPRNVYLMIAALWIFSFGMIFPPLIDQWGTLGLDEATFSCTIKKLDGKSPKKFLFLVAFLLPSIVIITCYSAIFYKIKTTRRKMENHSFRTPVSASKLRVQQLHKKHRKEDIKLTKMMLTIFVLFLVCFLPLMLVNVLDDDMKQPIYHIIASVLAWMSAAINPFIYSIQNQQYQKAFKSLLCFKEKPAHHLPKVNKSQDDKSEGLCPCFSGGGISPLATPSSSKASVNTLCIELKAVNKLGGVEQMQLPPLGGVEQMQLPPLPFPTDLCDEH